MSSNKADYKALYRAFLDINRLVHSGKTLREVLQRAVSKSTELINAKGALLRLYNEEKDLFEVAAAFGLGEMYLSKGPVSNKKILADLDGPDRVVIISDIWTAPRVEYPQEAWDEGIRMMLDIPLTLDLEIMGLMRIYLPEQREFSEEEKTLMVYMAEQCACAINKARFIENQKVRYDQLAIHTEKLSALGRMAAGIAHEINNPLAGILLFSTNLAKKVPLEGPLKEGMDIISREALRCKTIIQELLEFSRTREPLRMLSDINEIMEKSLRLLENEFRLGRIQLKKNLSSGIGKIYLDANQIEQVFINLLINAVHATPENGTITVNSCRLPEQSTVRIEIEDSGSGISPENLPKIFEPFFSTKEKGTGLGLAVSYGIIKNHSGNIDVKSHPQEGTRFTLDFQAQTEIGAAGNGQ
jgi:two-component system, NtrC family, sensor kinase